MSGYEYDATEEERAAAALLREKGWNVSEPKCPLCHGWGYIGRAMTWGSGAFGGGSYSQDPCPNGCPPPAMYFATGAAQGTITVADGTVGMRRGV